MIRHWRLLTIVLLLAALCGGGYVIGYQVGFGAAPTASVAAGPDGGVPEQFGLFWEAWQLAKQDYYKPDKLDPQEMTYGAIRGMLDSLGDPNTGFADPSQAKVADEDLRGTFDGIGVTVEMRNGLITVVAPLDGSPGEKAGIKPGDFVIKIDGRDSTAMSLMEAVALIRGPRGTAVELTIFRQGEQEPRVFSITRAEIKVESVQARLLDNGLAYVKISHFTGVTTELLKQRLADLLANKPKGLVLDLRNNPGGLLNEGVDVTSQFLAEGIVLYTQDRDTKEAANVKKGGLATSIPMVVLVNKGSASASEIVAAALQDYGRAKLIGEPTFGKDTVQNVRSLSDKSQVRITVARWLSPKNQEIHEVGLQPDIVIKRSDDDITNGRDPQLDRAVQELLAGR